MSVPRVSVIMPMYNSGQYVQAAIRSVLSQRVESFEVIAVDDGSSDDTVQRAQCLQDDRVRVVQLGSNQGIAAALNVAMEHARGSYLARMDADDLCVAGRLHTQVRFLERNPQLGACGTFLRTFGGRHCRIWRYPVTPGDIRASLPFFCPLAHPTVMFRADALRTHNLRYAHVPNAEDYDLWRRLTALVPVATIPRALLLRREHDLQVGRHGRTTQKASAGRVQLEVLRDFGVPLSGADAELFVSRRATSEATAERLERIAGLLARIARESSTCGCATLALKRAVHTEWHAVCRAYAKVLGMGAWRAFHAHAPVHGVPTGILKEVALLLKCARGGNRD